MLEHINTSEKPAINVQIIEDDGTNFVISFSGKQIDHSIVNAIRRTILTEIPIYGFHNSNIFIDTKETINIYNTNMINMVLETLPIFDINNNFDLENPEIYMANQEIRTEYSYLLNEKKTLPVGSEIDKVKNIEFSLNVINNSNTNIFASTHDAILKIDGKISNNYKKHEPISLFALKPREKISLRAIANLGIVNMNSIYEATTNVIFKKKDEHNYEMSYETLGQLKSIDIYKKACIILGKKLLLLQKFIDENYEERNVDDKIILSIYGEDHTLGNLISTTLKRDPEVMRAGYKIPHPLNNQLVIKYKLFPKSNTLPIQKLKDILNYLNKIFIYISKID